MDSTSSVSIRTGDRLLFRLLGIRMNQACSKLSSPVLLERMNSGLLLTGEEEEEGSFESLKSKSIRSPLSAPDNEPNLLILPLL